MSKAERFIQLNTKKYSNETRITIGRNSHWEKQPWLTPEQALAAVKIARGEVIDKACNYLFSHIGLFFIFFDDDIVEDIERSDFIKKFRKAMEDEK